MTQTEPYTTSAAEEAALANVTFADFALHPDIQKAIDAQGYTQPTPIQAKAIPVVLTGVDVMGAAQTGTGKTAGFSLPILNRLMPLATENTSPARHPVRALILTPTRELADQVAANVHTYAKFTPLRSTVVYGGVDINPQIQALRRGVELVIATPGRLLDHVQQKSINLGQVQVLVLDEADRMLDMGFLPDLQRIINLLPKTRQNLLFSATFSPEIQKLAKSFMVSPTLIEVARRNATSENIKQVIFALDSEEDKRMAVCHLIQSKALSQVIVFSNTKLGTARLAIYLEKQGVSSTAIHGDKTQIERTKSLEAFKAGEVTVLVATDVAARGLDIADLPCVINYDLPTTPEDYVHRIGRTGRAGAKGTAYSFVVKRDERALKDIEKLIGKAFVREELEGFVPGARAPREERGGREGRSDSRGASRTEGRSDRRPARTGDEAAPVRERRPSRDTSYQGARFNDNAPIHRDAEYERLRAKLAQTRVKDSLFNQPYQESKEDKAAAEAAAGQTSAGNNKPKSKNAAPVAFLLGGSPRN
ncbi:MAG: DEAD/DEAH box helicase [Pseudomonadota bacterium]